MPPAPLARCFAAALATLAAAGAQAALERREFALTVELELYFSCLVKKFVHFHELAPALESIAVTERLRVAFRPVTSTACSMDMAERLGRQPHARARHDRSPSDVRRT